MTTTAIQPAAIDETMTDNAPIWNTVRRCMDLVPIPLLMLLAGDTSMKQWKQRRNIFHANTAFREQVGYTLEDMRSVGDWGRLAYPDPVYRQQIKQQWSEVIDASLSRGSSVAELDALVQCSDGAQRWFVLTVELADSILPGANMVALRNVNELKVSLQLTNHMARTDALTGLLNRFAAERELAQAWEAFTERGENFSVAMCDVDWFKQVNDKHGHDAGDYVLRMIAQCMQESIHGNDRAVRWGGDEFMLILGESSSREAAATLVRLREAVAGRDWRWNGERLPLSLSIGGSMVSGDHQNLAELLSEADTAMYAAKRKGRNRICMYPPVD
jgi:diguanylate cyclase (GGDEF)-like protein